MKSLVICACEKVITDKASGATSLISVMKGAEAKFAIPSQPEPINISPGEIPFNTVTPNLWFVYAMWEGSPGDEGKEFEQVTEIFWPNGERFISNRLPFVLNDTLIAQNSVGSIGFPLGQEGDVKILAWVEQDRQRQCDPVEYNVTVRHPQN